MENASILIKDNTVQVNIPIEKRNIDKENRIVSGWATLDNLDQMGDVVTAEASLRAFQDFRGNVREMHNKLLAVGKVLNFRQEEFLGPNGQKHTGIWVDVYISKGAEDTWQKVLDGTLTGFSVYGPISSKGVSKRYHPEVDKMVNFVTDYALLELSLVDNPGNELCNFLSIQKSADGIEANGLATEAIEIENVFWCDKDEMAFVSKSETHACGYCRDDLKSLGWYEVVSDDQVNEVRKVLESNNKISKINTENDATEGGQEMADEVTEVNETEQTEGAVEETPEVEAVEENKEVQTVDEPDLAGIASALDEIKDTLKSTTKAGEEREAALSKVREAVEAVESNVQVKFADLLAKHEELAGELAYIKNGFGAVEKRLDTIEGATALRKSADVEDEGETLEKGNASKKSVWGNSFLPLSFDE
jgi:hypothetical protein